MNSYSTLSAAIPVIEQIEWHSILSLGISHASLLVIHKIKLFINKLISIAHNYTLVTVLPNINNFTPFALKVEN